ncbi:MAG: hypothetical protein GEV13_07245 [Rhodospirillales bacterium]|nr:hypothetical protein [Rhodospirillales bacterium]
MKRKSRTTARPFRPGALTWIDFLVIGAIAFTFIAIASTTISHAKASDYNDPPTFSTEVGHTPGDADLIKARIRLAVGGPWS